LGIFGVILLHHIITNIMIRSLCRKQWFFDANKYLAEQSENAFKLK